MALTRQQLLAAIATTEADIVKFESGLNSPIRSIRRSAKDAILLLKEHAHSLKQRLEALADEQMMNGGY